MIGLEQKAVKKEIKKFLEQLEILKIKRYPFWRLDTYFSNIKQTNLKIIEKGGWHFTNIKTPEELFEKFSNFGHHDEFELANLDLDKYKLKSKNKEVFYNHLADKKDHLIGGHLNYKLKKIDLNYLPKYLIENSEKFKDWID